MATTKDLATTGSAGGNNNTVIGQSILISGKLTGDEDLTVQGRVEGELTLSRTLIVEPTGVVKANVTAKGVIVQGKLDGSISASDRVELRQSAVVTGDLATQRISIEEGAFLKGKVDVQKEPSKA